MNWRPASALLLALWGGSAWAAVPDGGAPGGSRIERVTVYPGMAQVERVAKVAAGARELVLECLSPQFDVGSLQLESSDGVRLGPVSATTRPRADVPACDATPLDAQIRSLEDRIAALRAEAGGHELALGYLKGLSGSVPTEAAARAPLPQSGLAGLTHSIQRAGQDAYQQQYRLGRDREALERELQPLKAERDRLRGQGAQVRQLRIRLNASQDGQLRLRYQVNGPTWAPAYRAALDSDSVAASATLQLERLAQVSQRTGEDWQGVKLVLSTGSPRTSTQGPAPQPWEVVLRPPERPVAMMARAVPAPAPSMKWEASAGGASAAEDASGEDFSVQPVNSEFATEFEVPGTVDVDSAGKRVSLALGTQTLPAKLWVQSVPRASASAWLVAEVSRPQGVWPDGPMQLLRGNRAVGQGTWRSGDQDKLHLSFGRDELVSVRVLPVQQRNATSGFIGARQERREDHAYEVENRHRTPVELVVLESGPVARDEQIQVSSQYTPAPQPGGWQDLPGVVAWRQTLGAGQKARFAAEHLVSHPKDVPVMENR